MIFKSIRIKEGLFERTVLFSSRFNVIHSDRNSCGKTTLLRFMLYGLGYKIPSTRKIKFHQCEVETIIENSLGNELRLIRGQSEFIEVCSDAGTRTFVLPEQQMELHKLLFGIDNVDILNNLLGAYYVDQEKGWTLLNRGTVIGSIHFNIEELIRGLSNLDCEDKIKRKAQLSRDISKYQQMYSVALYRETIAKETKSVLSYDYHNETNAYLDRLLFEQKQVKDELQRIDGVLSDNKRTKDFIAKMKLLTRISDDKIIPVTENNIVGLTDSIDFLISKRKILSRHYNKLSEKINKTRDEVSKENEQQSLFQVETQIEHFDKNIAKLPLNQLSIKRTLDQLKKELKELNEEISTFTKMNNKFSSLMSKNMRKYISELNLGDKDSFPVSYLFTSNLKELSGAILHKMVFAFRLAYIIAIESATGLKFPIILDSPHGKEIDNENVRLMMDILQRDFSDHQIIVASIYEYDILGVNTIELKNRLIEAD